VLFQGDDLVMTKGSSTVSSARGGFVDAGTLPFINSHFLDEVTVRGIDLVRPGDLLFVPNGVNRGRYEIISILDDESLEVGFVADVPPRSITPAEFEDVTGEHFFLQRPERPNEIVSGTLTATAGLDIVEDLLGNFQWNGAAVDDLVIIDSVDANRGIYRLARVGTLDGFGEPQEMSDKLTLDRPLAVSSSVPYVIRREALYRNPIHDLVGRTVAGSRRWLAPIGSGLDILPIYPGDELRILSGADAGRQLRLLDRVDDDKLFVPEPFTTTETGVRVQIIRPLFGDPEDDTPNSDIIFEKLSAKDEVDLVVLRPRTVFLLLGDLSLGVSSATSGTDMTAAGVTDAMVLQIENASASSGVYEVDSVVSTTVVLTSQFRQAEAGVVGAFLEDDADFVVTGDTVTSVSLLDYEALGIIPGDIIVLDVVGTQEFVILTVSTGTLVLTQTTGLGPVASTGRILRRLS
jgi:hypothetical protein